MQQDMPLCATSAWLYASLANAKKVQQGQQGRHGQKGRQWCKAVISGGARRLRPVVQGSNGSGAGQLQHWYMAVTVVVQAGHRQEGRRWYKAYPGKQVSDRQASSGSACKGLVEGPEVQQLVCNCLSHCRICRHNKTTCQDMSALMSWSQKHIGTL